MGNEYEIFISTARYCGPAIFEVLRFTPGLARPECVASGSFAACAAAVRLMVSAP